MLTVRSFIKRVFFLFPQMCQIHHRLPESLVLGRTHVWSSGTLRCSMVASQFWVNVAQKENIQFYNLGLNKTLNCNTLKSLSKSLCSLRLCSGEKEEKKLQVDATEL